MSLGIQFENDSPVGLPSKLGRPVKVAGRVTDEISVGTTPVRETEVVENFETAGGRTGGSQKCDDQNRERSLHGFPLRTRDSIYRLPSLKLVESEFPFWRKNWR